MVKLVVFDFDGVVISSHILQKRALEAVYAAMGKNENPPYNEFFLRSGNSLINIFRELNIETEMIKVYREFCIKNIDMVKLQPGIKEVLKQLQSKGYDCALCTGKESDRTHQLLERFDLMQFFGCVVCSDQISNPKPHPESLLLIMKRYDYKHENLIMIGDGINDIRCAKNAGVKSVAVSWGDCSLEKLSKEFPDYMTNNVFEILKIIDQENEEIDCLQSDTNC